MKKLLIVVGTLFLGFSNCCEYVRADQNAAPKEPTPLLDESLCRELIISGMNKTEDPSTYTFLLVYSTSKEQNGVLVVYNTYRLTKESTKETWLVSVSVQLNRDTKAKITF